MLQQLGAPSVPMRSPKRLRKIPRGFTLSLGNAGEARWGCRGDSPPLLAAGHRAHLMPQQPTWNLQSMGAPVLIPSLGHICPHLLVVLVPSSCPTCLLLPLIPTPKDLSLSPGPTLSLSPGPTGPFSWSNLSPSLGPICSIFWSHFFPPPGSCPHLPVPSLGHACPQLPVSFISLSWSCWSPGTIFPLSSY